MFTLVIECLYNKRVIIRLTGLSACTSQFFMTLATVIVDLRLMSLEAP